MRTRCCHAKTVQKKQLQAEKSCFLFRFEAVADKEIHGHNTFVPICFIFKIYLRFPTSGRCNFSANYDPLVPSVRFGVKTQVSSKNILISKQISYGHFYIKHDYCQDIHLDIGACKMAYYKRIRELREDSDLTQRQVAEILKMPQPQYFRYEQGYRDIPTDILISLADLYQTSTDYILGRTNNPAPPEK